ncbi:5-formyltetrahydrofolate cyclo-ligase [Echinimonas agarilytica]|uniref:5-formyltetrahydrofolate cyclo-ligase n=1 Tax=Echinimonas agarilytica TaxID=1215918 RepID=A0AA41W5H4_9GAMM|nr:5-formyltetrahydrofolate cyclo-ligase [Echinimonas agarilytica]MCM2678887.1 5-formyltetrahydrofolate cyclo-ligase [Echinimonas agarilytica]
MTDLMATRAALRKQLRQQRQGLSAKQQSLASHALLENLQQVDAIKHANSLAVYLAGDGEIDLAPLIHWCWHEHKTLTVPVLHPFSKHHLLFLRYEPTTPMVRNCYGIFEPQLNVLDVLPVAHLDCMVLPLVGFDDQANRMGMGGGYYDRTLASWQQQRHAKSALIGVAHDCQKVAKLPVANWDVPLDQVVTPSIIIKNDQKDV